MEVKSTITTKNNIPHDLILEEVPVQPQPEPAPQEEQIEAQSTEDTVVDQTPEPPKETRSQGHFKALKTEAARLARERDEAMALLRQYELEKRTRQTTSYIPEPEANDFNIDDDAGVEGKHIKALSKQLKSIQQDLAATRAETKKNAIRNTLLAEHPDYERVVNADNLRALELLKPHLARAIDLSDPYAAGQACYELIKQFGIDSNEVEKTTLTQALIKENLAKPKPGIAASGTKNVNTSPLGRASEFYEGPLTDEMKKMFYKELKDAMEGPRR